MKQNASKANRFSYLRNSPPFTEPKGSLTHIQVPVTYPFPDPDRSSPCPTSHVLKIHLNMIFPPKPGSSKCAVSLRFPHQNYV